MAHVIVALSGPVASGKTTLARRLADRYGATVVHTHDLLEARARSRRGAELRARRALQEFGDVLDKGTEGAWVADDVEARLSAIPDRTLVIVDAVRIAAQIAQLRERFGRRVVHLHLQAPADDLAHRYANKTSGIDELADYQQVRENATEANVEALAHVADATIDTGLNDEVDVEVRAAARLGLLPPLGEQLVDVLVGGQYGSEGKGNIAFYLAPEYDVLMRVGGPNAGHKVPTKPVTTHHSLPSGTLAAPHARLLIGPGAVLRVPVLLKEIADAGVCSDRLAIDPQAMLIADDDINAEAELVAEIGSTGQGVGQATARRIRRSGVVLAGDHHDLKPYISETRDLLDDALARGDRVMLEGTQGTALSLYHGSYPHVTSRDTTAAGCLAEAGISPRRVRRVIIVCRSYPIRVGGPSGPMRQEIDWRTVAERAEIPYDEIAGVEVGSVTGRERRVAEFDWQLLRRAAEINGATDVALTFADYHRPGNRDAYRFDQLHRETIRFVEEIENVAGCPVTLIATRFAARSVIDRRDWRGHILNRRDVTVPQTA